MTEVEMASTPKIPTIPEVFNGKKVLITGATGFVGKVLLEKLLRSCPDISEITVIIRGESDAEIEKKYKKLINHRVFDRIKEECPDALKKVRAIEGQITCTGFMIEPNIKEVLCKETSFVFHCAANVRFDCDPDSTLSVNLKGVKHLLKLCKQMPKLEAVVHVSTAYSFCNHPIIGEEIYPETVGPGPVMEALKWMNADQLKHFAGHLVEGRPSLYHVSKAMAEILISERRDNLPIIIVRPSIVTASMKEPFPGWVDNYNGPSGFIAMSSRGILKTIQVKEKVNADWVPVDIVANTLIAAAHFMALKGNSASSSQIDTSKVPIINCVFPEDSQTTWTNIINICLPILLKYPSANVYSIPGGVVTSSKTINTICKYLFHYLPAVFIDIVGFCIYRNYDLFRLVGAYRRVHGALNHLQLFTTHQFFFTSKNMQHLTKEMRPVDRIIFPIDLNCFDWPLYMQDYVLGVRRHYLREKDDSLPAARKRVKVLTLVHNASILMLTGTVVYLLVKRFPTKPRALEIKHATTELFKSCWNCLPKISHKHN